MYHPQALPRRPVSGCCDFHYLCARKQKRLITAFLTLLAYRVDEKIDNQS
jgi:hypothetical protein